MKINEMTMSEIVAYAVELGFKRMYRQVYTSWSSSEEIKAYNYLQQNAPELF